MSFTHDDPLEGTETLGDGLKRRDRRCFTHDDPLEGTETQSGNVQSLHPICFTHDDPLEGTETLLLKNTNRRKHALHSRRPA